MIESLLIANRGEIARRIIRTARRLGVRTIAVHSDVDAALPFVREADEAVAIGPAPARESYLDGAKILHAAKQTGAAAIHPGYGFLSENAGFADAVIDAGLVWVGAPPGAIRAMGLKDAAKRLMQKAGVPVTPGYLGEDQSPARLQAEADAIGYPVIIKAVAGGGGKGMRVVRDAGAFAEALLSCRREAAASFGDDRVLLERYILAPRHIEVQVFGDQHGNAVHLFERDCSLQRRHQKVIEEAPAHGMDDATREAICDAALRAARAVHYVGAGTIEFIADASDGLRADRIWFMEMNTRLQVEHPVTEAITGLDLVEWQLRVACGEQLPLAQAEITRSGAAMEARLYAENPASGFLPSTGPLEHLRLPLGLRVDSGVEEGSEVTGFYDPIIAKLITHAPTRAAAAAALAAACARVEVWPVRTNAAFLARAAADPDFLAGRLDTGFIERHAARLIPPAEPGAEVLQEAARALIPPATPDPWTRLPGFRIGLPAAPRIAVDICNAIHVIELDAAMPRRAGFITLADGTRLLFLAGQAWPFAAPAADVADGASAASGGNVLSPMPGRVAALDVAIGERVTKGQRLIVIEAMKMELALTSPQDGRIAEISAQLGAQVAEGVTLIRVCDDS